MICDPEGVVLSWLGFQGLRIVAGGERSPGYLNCLPQLPDIMVVSKYHDKKIMRRRQSPRTSGHPEKPARDRGKAGIVRRGGSWILRAPDFHKRRTGLQSPAATGKAPRVC